jgi:hypothetical protein
MRLQCAFCSRDVPAAEHDRALIEPLRPGDNPLADQLIEENDRLRRERNDYFNEVVDLRAEVSRLGAGRWWWVLPAILTAAYVVVAAYALKEHRWER